MRLAFTAALIALSLASVHASGQGPAPKAPASKAASPNAATTAAAPQLTAADLESFLDGLMPLEIEHANVAGAVVAVVKDGKLLFAKGYGYADARNRTPVSPETTLFRVGSISKLFTWTAVMQQVELGKLDLDRDVNTYIDFRIPTRHGKPITLRDIMTHRSGFEETIKDLFVRSARDLQPMERYLPIHLPARIFPPGAVPAYSNYAATLAAYIVQRVAKQPFDDYVEAHILRPLDMAHATFRQPLPDALKPLMSRGYRLGSGEPQDFEFVDVAPAGSLAASAEAMSHFMIAHLQNGRYGDVQILKPETAVQMHQRQNGWPAAMNAMCLGFYEETRNGQRIIGHGGDTQWFHSDLHLLLDANVGLFVSYNSAGKDDYSLRGLLLDRFMDRYFPVPPRTQATPSTALQDARNVAGVYEISRRFETNILAISALLGEATVTVQPKDSTIALANAFKSVNGQPKRFREVAPMVFRAMDGHEQLAFQTDPNGRRMIFIDYPFMVFQRVNRTADRRIANLVIIGYSLAVIALTLVFWPVAAMMRKHYARPLTLTPQARRLRVLVRAVCAVIVVYMICLAIVLSSLQNVSGATSIMDLKLHLLQVMGLLTGIGAAIAVFSALQSWRDAGQWRWYKIWNTLLALACCGFFWILWHSHLLNFRLNY
jgi:CubicO group peptidase (beta-lactamase class C family)